MERTVRTPAGGRLAVEDAGDPTGRPVLVHHGIPSSRKAAFYGPWVRDAANRGLRLISYDRPGYGGSPARPGRSVADTAADVRALCAELGIERLATWGFSGGGAHALACAALLPGLVTAAASLAGVAPFDAEGLDWFAGQHRDQIEETRLFLADKPAARRQMNRDRQDYLTASASGSAGAGFHGFALLTTRAGLAPGIRGWWDDRAMQLRPWGFDCTAITVPVLLLYGRQDIIVPPGHGEWLAKRIMGAETRWFDDDGHASLARDRVPEVQAWLAERF